jgi:hypothetical protein
MNGVFATEMSGNFSSVQRPKTDKDIAAFLFLGTDCSFQDFSDIIGNFSKQEEISFEENNGNENSKNFDTEESLEFGVCGENLNSVLFLTPDSTIKFEQKDQKIAENINIDNEEMSEIISNDKSFAFEEKNEINETKDAKDAIPQKFMNEKNIEQTKNESLDPKKNMGFVGKKNFENKTKVLEKINKVDLNEKDAVKNNKVNSDDSIKIDKTIKEVESKIKVEKLEDQIVTKKEFLKEKNFDFNKSEQNLNSNKLLKSKEFKDMFEVFVENKDYSFKNLKNVKSDVENKGYLMDKNYENNTKEKVGTERIKLDIVDEKIGKINLDMKIKNGEMNIKFDSDDKEKNKNIIFNKSEIEEQIVKNTGVKKAEISLYVNPEDRKEKNDKNKKKALYAKKNDKNKESFKVEI